jgi:hypothetical protein
MQSSKNPTMSRPKRRAFLSVNVNSNAEHIYERVEDHNKESKDRLKVLEQTQPTVGNSSIHIITRPFEKEVQRSIERVVDGRVVRDTTTYRSTSPSPSNRHKEGSSKKRASIEDKYDTSDL